MHKLKIAGAVAAVFLAGCSVGDAPPGADFASDASVAGLFDLFQRECIEQRSLEWARRKAPQQSWLCDSGCVANEGIVSWVVPTRSGSSAKITLWFPHGHPERMTSVPPERVTCQMEVGDDLGLYMEDAAIQAAVAAGLKRDAIFRSLGSDADSGARNWIWPPADGDPAKPQIELYSSHSSTPVDPDEVARTWELRYAVFKHGPFIW